MQVASNVASGQSLKDAATNVDVKSIAVSAALGAVGRCWGIWNEPSQSPIGRKKSYCRRENVVYLECKDSW